MKRVLKSTMAATAIGTVIFFTACNNSSEKTTTNTKDSVSADSPLTDAVNTADSVNKKMEDSTGKVKDTMIKK